MCLLIFAHAIHRRYPLIVAANRDEFHARPTAASTFWADHPQVLAGRDLEQGGTWMGVTRSGRFAAVTNFRDPSRTAPAPCSRGELPLAFLSGRDSPAEFLEKASNTAEEYAGYNLLVGDRKELWYLTNSRPGETCRPLALAPGIYGLSNATLDSPWPKVTLGKERMQSLLDTAEPSHDELAQVVGDRRLATVEQLRGHGLGSEMEQLLSAQFIVTPTYGTRSRTTLMLEHSGGGNWREQSFDASGALVSTREERFGSPEKNFG